MAGRAKVVWDDGTRRRWSRPSSQPGLGYSCSIGQRHRLVGVTDCDVLEVSTPEIGTTFRLEDDYARPDETEAVRHEPGRAWTHEAADVDRRRRMRRIKAPRRTAGASADAVGTPLTRGRPAFRATCV